MNDIEQAKAALRELGIKKPSPQLVENWLKAATASEDNEADAPSRVEARAEPSEPTTETLSKDKAAHNSRSRLEPVLRDAGTLERPPGPRKPGRPRIIASWFEKVAEIMADGTSLSTALAMCGLSLSRSEVRACYRNRTLQALYQEGRRRYLAEHYGRKPTLRAKIGRYL